MIFGSYSVGVALYEDFTIQVSLVPYMEKNAIILTGGHKEYKGRKDERPFSQGWQTPYHHILNLMKVLHGKACISTVYYCVCWTQTGLQYLEKPIWHLLLAEILKIKQEFRYSASYVRNDLLLLPSPLQANFYQLLVTFHFGWPVWKVDMLLF